jgi:hypothetical protein
MAMIAGCALTLVGAMDCTSERARDEERQARERGGQLFAGERPLTATMAGHTAPLPQDAVRCTNCHRREADAVVRSAADAALDVTQDFGPGLGASALTRAVARRGGPPSVYDGAAFCRVLREGIDPAHVVIAQTMPRYTMTPAECESLWIFLTAPSAPSHAAHSSAEPVQRRSGRSLRRRARTATPVSSIPPSRRRASR